MKKLCLLFVFLSAIYTMSHSPSAFGWSTDNHQDISEVAVKYSVLSAENGNFAKLNLGLEAGLETSIAVDPSKQGEEKGLTPVDMIKRGAVKEDSWCWQTDHWQGSDVSCLSYWGRFNHHFHNPYEDDWDEAGLSDIFNGNSSLLWAQDDDQTWSWNNLRNMYYEALIGADYSQGERRFKLAKLFRGIGHQLHLI